MMSRGGSRKTGMGRKNIQQRNAPVGDLENGLLGAFPSAVNAF